VIAWQESTDRETVQRAVLMLKRQVERAYFYCREEQANDAHNDLIRAEWRLRQIERRAK
jgi:hypothetical protein